ncbi:SDR family oxidoreductase [Arthrobacter sp. NPDC093128]|uniref:SDR family NAD(P)-dependent oxidoreductase n=1 Tax=Arthrobacter sp. NPDC093128 TaxID=3154979 RepID=UPI0034213F22
MTSSQSVSVVTGGAGALGSAIVKRLAELGDTVIVVDRDGVAAGEIADKINSAGQGRAVAWESDVSSEDQNGALVEWLRSEFGRLDRLINNAALGQRSKFGQIKHDEWSRVLDVNLWGAASLCQAATPLWRERPGASVVNLSSRAWLTGGPLAYVASKAGIVGLTHALAVELGPYNVRVNAVAPGTVITPMVASNRDAEAYEAHLQHVRKLPVLPGLATAEDIASAVAFLASAEAGFITGEVLHVAGGAQLAPPGH